MKQSSLLTTLVGLVTFTAGSVIADTGVSYGLAKDVAWDAAEHIELMESHGLTDHATVFYNLLSPDNIEHPYDWVQDRYLDAGYDVVFTLLLNGVDEHSLARSESSESTEITGYLQRILDGYYDEQMTILAKEMHLDGRPIVFRPLHEGDGGWYGWGMYAAGNSPELFVEAFIHVVETFQAEQAPIEVELNLNRRDGKSPPEVMGDIDLWFDKLDPYIDMYSISTYNRCKTNRHAYQDWRSFSKEFAPAYAALAARTQKPINVAEVSTTAICGTRLPWFVNMLKDIDELYTQVEMVSFYFGTVPVGAASNDVTIKWGFPTESQVTAFKYVMDLVHKSPSISGKRPAPNPRN